MARISKFDTLLKESVVLGSTKAEDIKLNNTLKSNLKVNTVSEAIQLLTSKIEDIKTEVGYSNPTSESKAIHERLNYLESELALRAYSGHKHSGSVEELEQKINKTIADIYVELNKMNGFESLIDTKIAQELSYDAPELSIKELTTEVNANAENRHSNIYYSYQGKHFEEDYYAKTITWFDENTNEYGFSSVYADLEGRYPRFCGVENEIYCFPSYIIDSKIPNNKFFKYNIDTGVFTKLANTPFTNSMVAGVTAHANGKIYLFNNQSTPTNANPTTIGVYDIATNTWSTREGNGFFYKSHKVHNLTWLVGDKIYAIQEEEVAEGNKYNLIIKSYDTINNTYSKEAEIRSSIKTEVLNYRYGGLCQNDKYFYILSVDPYHSTFKPTEKGRVMFNVVIDKSTAKVISVHDDPLTEPVFDYGKNMIWFSAPYYIKANGDVCTNSIVFMSSVYNKKIILTHGKKYILRNEFDRIDTKIEKEMQSIATNFTTEKVGDDFIIKYNNIIIARIPLAPPEPTVGSVDGNNDISLHGLQSGTYVLKFEGDSGSIEGFDNIGTVEVK